MKDDNKQEEGPDGEPLGEGAAEGEGVDQVEATTDGDLGRAKSRKSIVKSG